MNSTDNYSLLIDKINIFIRKYYFNNFLRGLIFLGAGLFSAYVVVTVGEYLGNFNSLFRTLIFYLFILLNLGLIVWLIVPSLLAWLKLGKSLTHDQAAEIIGKHFNDVNDKLLNTLQLKKLASEDEQHRALIEASIDQKIEALKPVSFPSAINIKENTKYLKWILFPAGIICIIALAAPSILTESTKKLIRHNEYFAPVAPFSFIVQNKNLSVVQGDDFKLDLKLAGNNLPADVYVETANNTFKLDKENISKFHYQFTNLQQNTYFRLSGNGFTSVQYEIKVNLRPALLHFDAELNYPSYLHKKNETLANAGDLTIPAGTIVTWKFHTQNATGLLFFLNGNTGGVNPIATDVFEHRERVLKNSVYKVAPINNRINHADSASYRINVIADEAPTITVDERQDSVSMKALYFNGRIQDDHGFSDLTFHYIVGDPADKASQKSFSKPVKADLGAAQSDFFYFWNLKELGIKAGDKVTYYFEVADNDGVNGPKKVRSPEHTLNIPDTKEMNNELNAGTQQVKQKMQSAIKIAGQIEHDSQKLNQMLLDKNTLSFDEKKQIADLLEKKKDLDNLVKEIQGDNKKNLYNRQENQPQDKALTEKQQQMEQLLNNVLDPKTQEMLEKLQQMLQNEQKEGTRDQLSKMQNENKSLKKELDRMLELYKRLEFEQKLNQNVTQLNQLSQEQQKLADQAKQPNADQQQLQKDQQKLNQDFQDVKKSLEDLQKTDEQAEHKQDFKNPVQEEQHIEQQMQQSSDELKKNDAAKASQSQQQASKSMKELANKMEQKDQEGAETETTIDEQQLRQLLKNLINSSFDQEKVMQTLKSTNPADPGYLSLAQNQKSIKDNLKTAEDSLYALSRKVPQIQSTVNQEIAAINTHIDDALDNLGDRHTAEATRNQQFAMTSMNNLALMLSEALEQLQNAKNKGGGKRKGKQQSIAQLAKMQEQLNQNMQKARQQMQQQGAQGNQGKSKSGNNGNNENISEQLAKLARQQQMIREALQQINRDDNKDGTGSLGNLDKISKQMEQTEHDLVNRSISEEALTRQQQIKSRLLEAEKAEQQRDQDQQRESHAGKEIPPGYIKALQEYQQAKQKQTEQVRTVPPDLSLYYKLKIKDYFDLLNAK
ncbi:hypothetical protein JN11_01036 [Mucilaginibacter frigoritolerans]|uniref:DUF4175 family protein n=1 Tax=Mucilaginibacter frigoritolerans TaxID=652788 RepID=A0A562UCF2_9SPHI|nr:DUF4175 family protein [Mucilaginibacter frigoritolerans]TWJ03492.1 hypothetical protein JN11_01036 [Mucilaginibacter frigoritolerans]